MLAAQVDGYARLLRALVRRYGIAREFAMITHQSVDPTRRTDPGELWIKEHAWALVEEAYQ